MFKILITGNKAFPPEMLAEKLKERLSTQYSFDVEVLKFENVPVKEFHLYDDTIVPTGMSVEDPNIKKPFFDGIREYYGDPLALLEKIGDVDLLILHGSALPRQVIEKAEKLKCVVVTRGGPVNVDSAYLKEKGIPLYHPSGRNATGVAELTIGLLLVLIRKLAVSNNLLKQDIWTLKFNTFETLGSELYNKRFGLIGFGNIARHLSKILKGFESEVVAFDPFVPFEIFSEYGVQNVSKEELLKTSDIVSLHARAKKGEPPIIGKEELRMMKSSAILANTARGMLLDYFALKDALIAGKIAGAVLDVYGEGEFKIYKEIIALPNVFGTSHLGGSTREAALRGFSMTVDILENILPQYLD